MSAVFKLGQDNLTWRVLTELASRPSPAVTVTLDSWTKIEKFRQTIDQAVASGKVIYGVNTGFGFLSDVKIETNKLQELQLNLIRSHACGVGELSPAEHVRALLILRAHTFLLGYSALRKSSIEVVLDFLKHDILPIVPQIGSVGASGDLAPLSHLALGLIGEGEVFYKGQIMAADEAINIAGIKRIIPDAKEGLSLINGTQYMTVVGSFALRLADNVLNAADIMACLSLDAIRGTDNAFDDRIQSVRQQPGQKVVAANLRRYLYEDQIMASHLDCGKVQDPYSFRCVPQVHGASRDVFDFVEARINGELNSVTDNPLVFEDGSVLSGGNFHGQPIAMALDFLAIALAEIGSISERRIEKITNPAMSGLPAFVVKESGLNSGFMIPHVVAASLVSENKILCHPASVDSIPTSADKEDHVSMGPIAARKALKVAQHVCDILAIEGLTACQGIDLLAPLKPSKPLRAVHQAIRALSPSMSVDRSLYKDIQRVSQFIASGKSKDCLDAVGA